MSEFDDIDAAIAALQDEILGISTDIVVKKLEVEENRTVDEELKAAEIAAAQALADIKAKKAAHAKAYQAQMQEVRRLREIEAEKNRKLQTFFSEKRLRDQFAHLSDELDRLTAESAWRHGITLSNGKVIRAKHHQIEGAKKLATSKRAILGDRRGLGKTGTSIIFMEMAMAKKTLIFVPKDVSKNFESEIQKWAPGRPVMVMTGLPRDTRNVMLIGLQHAPEFTVILNYEAWRKDDTLLDSLIACNFDTVIIDEAHNIKNTQSDAYQGIKKLVYAENCCPLCGHNKFDVNPQTQKKFCKVCLVEQVNFGDFCSVQRVLPMTGTVILNRPDDMWGLLYLVDRIQFNSKMQFLRDYCRQDFITGRWRFKSGGEEELLKKLGMRYVGRTPESAGVEMPPQEITWHEVLFDPMSYPKQADVIAQVRMGAIKMAENKALSVPGILAEITRMSQALTWPAGIQIKDPETGVVLYTAPAHESVKVDKTIEIIQQAIEEGDRVIVFSRFKEALKEVERRLNELDIRNIRYDGDISDARAREAQLDFDVKTASKTDYKWQVLLGQYQKTSTGLNFNAARQMVIMDRYWSPGREDQAQGRIQRMDTEHDTIVHQITINFAKSKSIDNWMNELIDGKADMLKGFDDKNEENQRMELRDLFDGIISEGF